MTQPNVGAMRVLEEEKGGSLTESRRLRGKASAPRTFLWVHAPVPLHSGRGALVARPAADELVQAFATTIKATFLCINNKTHPHITTSLFSIPSFTSVESDIQGLPPTTMSDYGGEDDFGDQVGGGEG